MALLTDEEWSEYKLTYKKSYADDVEDAKRRSIVAECKEFVDNHNKKYEAGEVSYNCGLNHFSDRTKEEKSRRCGLKK